MTPDETPPSRDALAGDVAARLRAAGLNAVQDGENVTVFERPKTTPGQGGAATGGTVAAVFGVAIIASLLIAIASLTSGYGKGVVVVAVLVVVGIGLAGGRWFRKRSGTRR